MIFLYAIAIALVLSATAASAQKGDLEFGRYLATECLTCHRSATATSTIPNIFGLPEARFTLLVKAYRDKKLASEVMQTIASRLKDDDIEALAHYFSVTKRP